MLAPDGRCKTLDAAADGYVRAEACGALVLSAMGLEQAAEERTLLAPRALALIASSSVNQVRFGKRLWRTTPEPWMAAASKCRRPCFQAALQTGCACFCWFPKSCSFEPSSVKNKQGVR